MDFRVKEPLIIVCTCHFSRCFICLRDLTCPLEERYSDLALSVAFFAGDEDKEADSTSTQSFYKPVHHHLIRIYTLEIVLKY